MNNCYGGFMLDLLRLLHFQYSNTGKINCFYVAKTHFAFQPIIYDLK